LVDVADHFAKFGWGLIPRMTAAFLKVIFRLEEGVFPSQGAQVVRCGPLACGSFVWTKGLETLRLII
jgi:hypothetical protein